MSPFVGELTEKLLLLRRGLNGFYLFHLYYGRSVGHDLMRMRMMW
jgi:hypothetical protein